MLASDYFKKTMSASCTAWKIAKSILPIKVSSTVKLLAITKTLLGKVSAGSKRMMNQESLAFKVEKYFLDQTASSK